MTANAVEVDQVWKTFRIFHDRNTTLKQAVLRRGKESFEEFWALRDVSFEIPEGSSFAIVGANGAGKSTMLKTLARILVPDKGAVSVKGRVSALLELGAGFHPEMSGRENVFLNGNILGMGSAALRAKFDDIVEFSGLAEFIDRPVKTYSSGMYARLGFSVAVAVEPDILLIDEVLAVGDEQFQRRCTEKMDEIRASGRTVVFVSHGLSQVQQLCDQAVWLDKGVVQCAGATSDVIDAYLASVNTAYRIDDQGRQRTGSGEIQLEVELLPDVASQPIETAAPLTIRMHWKSQQVIDDVAFRLSIRSADGTTIATTSSPKNASTQRVGPGSGWLDYEIPSLPLLPGSYHIAASITDARTDHSYDHSPHIAAFDIAPNSAFDAETGLASMYGHWTIGGDAQ